MKTAWPFARAAAAVLITIALTVQFAASTTAAHERGWDVGGTIANFFSLFSVQANIAGALVLAAGAVAAWTGRGARSEALGVAIACAATYVIWTGIVYNIFLRTPALPEGTRVVWSNEVVHVLIPLFFVADLLLAPPTRALAWRAVALIPVFPVLWGVYTLLRGPLTVNPRTGADHWYPYVFMDPHLMVGGHAGVALNMVVLPAAIAGVGLLVVAVGRARCRSARQLSLAASGMAPRGRQLD